MQIVEPTFEMRHKPQGFLIIFILLTSKYYCYMCTSQELNTLRLRLKPTSFAPF